MHIEIPLCGCGMSLLKKRFFILLVAMLDSLPSLVQIQIHVSYIIPLSEARQLPGFRWKITL